MLTGPGEVGDAWLFCCAANEPPVKVPRLNSTSCGLIPHREWQIRNYCHDKIY